MAKKNGNSKTNLSKRAKTQARVGGKFAKKVTAAPNASPGINVPPVPEPARNLLPKVNYIALVVDGSGSMNIHKSRAAEVVNSQLQRIWEESRITGQTTRVIVVAFDDRHVIRHMSEGDKFSYPWMQGSTALWNAVWHGADELERLHKKDGNVDFAFTIITTTDGEENASHYAFPNLDASSFNSWVRSKIATDRWTFGFATPPGGRRVLESFGVHAGNITEWETTKAGFDRLEQQTRKAIGNIYVARSAGLTSTNTAQANLFAVDLSKQGSALKQAKWDPLENHFKSYKVEREMGIKPFLESKQGTFVEGEGYYELTKKELVQAYKDLVVQDKTTKKVLAGTPAKAAIGLPIGADHKVDPFNLGPYKIFVQSTSNNRKLVRGTEVLVVKRK